MSLASPLCEAGGGGGVCSASAQGGESARRARSAVLCSASLVCVWNGRYASWCRVCVFLEPRFKKLAREYEDKAIFVKLDAIVLEYNDGAALCDSRGASFATSDRVCPLIALVACAQVRRGLATSRHCVA